MTVLYIAQNRYQKIKIINRHIQSYNLVLKQANLFIDFLL